MRILDTDHLSILEWTNSPGARVLRARLRKLSPADSATTIVNCEEQIRGWMSVVARARKVKEHIEAYRQLQRRIELFGSMPLLPFDEAAAVEFQRLRKQLPRLGAMDLKVAAIALVHKATVLSRNLADFRRVPGLQAEDWSVPEK